MRCGGLWLYSSLEADFFHLLLSIHHHTCPVPFTLSLCSLATTLTPCLVSLSSLFHLHCIHNCLLAPTFSHQLVSYFLIQFVFVLQHHNLAFALNMPPFSNIILPTFNSTPLLSSTGSNSLFFLLTTSQQFPALASFVLRNRQLCPLPSQCPGKGQELVTLQHPEPSSAP